MGMEWVHIESKTRRGILAALVGADPEHSWLEMRGSAVRLVSDSGYVEVEFPNGWECVGVWNRLLAQDRKEHEEARSRRGVQQ